MDVAFLVQMKQFNKCGSVRYDQIINLHLGSVEGSWVSIPCLLQDTSYIYWFNLPKTIILYQSLKNKKMKMINGLLRPLERDSRDLKLHKKLPTNNYSVPLQKWKHLGQMLIALVCQIRLWRYTGKCLMSNELRLQHKNSKSIYSNSKKVT